MKHYSYQNWEQQITFKIQGNEFIILYEMNHFWVRSEFISRFTQLIGYFKTRATCSSIVIAYEIDRPEKFQWKI